MPTGGWTYGPAPSSTAWSAWAWCQARSDLRTQASSVGDGQAGSAGPVADLAGRGRRSDAARGVVGSPFVVVRADPGLRGTLRLGPRVRGGEVPVGPLLGQLAVLAEHDRHVRPTDLQLGQPVGDQGRADPVEGEHLRVPVLDHHRRARQGGQLGDGETQPATGQARDQVGQRLALDRGDEPPGVGDGVVPARQTAPHGAHLLPGEGVRVALVGVDHDLELVDARRARRRQPHVRTGLLAGPRRLPEHHLATAGAGEHDLGTLLAGAVGDDVDRRTTTGAGPQRDPLDDVRLRGPLGYVHRVAVDGVRPWPGGLGPEHQPSPQRHPQQVRQGAVRIGIAGDQQLHPTSVPPGGQDR